MRENISEDNRLRMSFSPILEKKGKRMIDLNEAGSSSALPGLVKIIMWENIHRIGK